MRRIGAAAVVALFVIVMCGCTTYRDQLVRSQRAFDQNQHDQALGLLRDLEKDQKSLSMPEQAQYAYLRGMTDYRVGYRNDARHWLSIARAIDESSPGVLPVDWKTRLGEAMEEMNTIVYEDGVQTLAAAKKPSPVEKSTPQVTEPVP